jgi:hypothetical protein
MSFPHMQSVALIFFSLLANLASSPRLVSISDLQITSFVSPGRLLDY